MKEERFKEILKQFWPAYSNGWISSTIKNPELLAYFAIYCFQHNLQGKAIDEVRNFYRAFDKGDENFRK